MANNLDVEILKGRIYPAIQSCIGNRYKILLSFFAFYSFIMTSTSPSIKDHFIDIQRYTSILFALLTVLNSFNYWRNSKEQWEKENPGAKKDKDRIKRWFQRNDVELGFILIMGGLIMLSLWKI